MSNFWGLTADKLLLQPFYFAQWCSLFLLPAYSLLPPLYLRKGNAELRWDKEGSKIVFFHVLGCKILMSMGFNKTVLLHLHEINILSPYMLWRAQVVVIPTALKNNLYHVCSLFGDDFLSMTVDIAGPALFYHGNVKSWQ